MILGIGSIQSQGIYGKVLTKNQLEQLKLDTNLVITKCKTVLKNGYSTSKSYEIYNKKTQLRDTIYFIIQKKQNCPTCGKG